MKELTQSLGYTFQNTDLLEQALTHRSHQNDSYERLEFLGDRVLGLAISNLLYTAFPAYNEGQLAKHYTALVREETLVIIAERINLLPNIRLGKSAPPQESLPASILADVMEALLGAIFLENGFSAVKTVIETLWEPLIKTVSLTDGKTALQEFLQAKNHPLPVYSVIKIQGKDHERTFRISVTCALGSEEGEGQSKRQAEQKAAAALLHKLENSSIS